MSKVFVVFPVHNGLESTRSFLESLSRQGLDGFETVICDDGSDDGTGEYLRHDHPEVTVLEGTGNLWWTGGINMCIRHVLKKCSDDEAHATRVMI